MGTLIGHVVPGVGFLLIGLWHLSNILRSYAREPEEFHTRAWWPACTGGGKKKKKLVQHVELLAIAGGAILSISAELFICPARHQPLADDWSIPSVHLNNFEHSSISLFFLLYALAALVASLASIELPHGLLHALAAVMFSQELLLFHLHSADHMGLEGHYHWLLQLLIAVCLATTLTEIVSPRSLLPALGRSLSTALQGAWMVQMGLVLWIPAFTPYGCSMGGPEDHPMVVCVDEEHLHRAKALATLQFNWYIAGFVFFTGAALLALLKRPDGSRYAPISEAPGKFSLEETEDGLNRPRHKSSGSDSSIDMEGFSVGR